MISASNTDVYQLIQNEDFREDLFYRLNVISINIPPLRQRREDIPLLVDHFNKKLSRENNSKPLRISNSIMKLLEDYSWPGNVRELENFIHRMVIFNDVQIDMDDIPKHMKISIEDSGEGHFKSLAEIEREYILKVLKANDNNKSKAAEILKIDRKTLRNKLS